MVLHCVTSCQMATYTATTTLSRASNRNNGGEGGRNKLGPFFFWRTEECFRNSPYTSGEIKSTHQYNLGVTGEGQHVAQSMISGIKQLFLFLQSKCHRTAHCCEKQTPLNQKLIQCWGNTTFENNESRYIHGVQYSLFYCFSIISFGLFSGHIRLALKWF